MNKKYFLIKNQVGKFYNYKNKTFVDYNFSSRYNNEGESLLDISTALKKCEYCEIVKMYSNE